MIVDGADGSSCAVCRAPKRIAALGTLSSPAADERSAGAGAAGLNEGGAPARCVRYAYALSSQVLSAASCAAPSTPSANR